MTLVIGFFNEKLAQDQLLTLNIFNPSYNVSILDFNIWVFTPRTLLIIIIISILVVYQRNIQLRKNTFEIPKYSPTP